MGESTWAEPTLNFFTASQCGSIHRSALEILRRTGVRVFNEEALKLLYMAETAMPIVYSPAPMIGGTTAGGLAIGAAEGLRGSGYPSVETDRGKTLGARVREKALEQLKNAQGSPLSDSLADEVDYIPGLKQ